MKRSLAVFCLLTGCSAPAPSGPDLPPAWSSPLAGVAAPVVRDGRVYMRGYHAGTHEGIQLFALDATSGKELWSTPLSGSEGSLRATADARLLADGKTYSSTTGKVLSNTAGLVDEKTERMAASQRPELSRSSASDTCWDGLYYCFDKESNLLAYDLAHKRVAWQRPLASAPAERRVQAEPIGLLVTAGNLSLLEPRSGKLVWSYSLPAQGSFARLLRTSGSLVLAQANEYTNTTQGGPHTFWPALVALQDGRELWRYAPVHGILSADEKQIVVTGLNPDRGDFHAALDPSTGKELWRAAGYAQGPVRHDQIFQTHHDQHTDWSGNWTGDKRGGKVKGGIQFPDPVSTAYLEARDRGVPLWHGPTYPTSEMYGPVLDGDSLYVCVLSQMQGGTSAVQAYKLQEK